MDKYLRLCASLLGIDGFDYGDDFDDDIDYSDDIEDEYSDDNSYYENVSDGVSFGSTSNTITVHQVGNSNIEKTLNVEKIPGTSNQWNVMKGNEVIAKVNSLTNASFYVPGIGRCTT